MNTFQGPALSELLRRWREPLWSAAYGFIIIESMFFYFLLQAICGLPHVLQDLIEHGQALVLMLHVFKGFHLMLFCSKKFHIFCLFLFICKK
jgi:hypothetical protein